MSIAIAHFAVGAGLTALVVAAFAPRIWCARTLSLLGGVWAMVPDLHWVSPVAHRQLIALRTSAWGDLFWFHRALDLLDPADSKAVGAACVAFFVAATACAEYWTRRSPTPVERAYEVSANEKASGD
jgi:hypothetical protein